MHCPAGYGGGHNSSVFFGGLPPPLPLPAGLTAAGLAAAGLAAPGALPSLSMGGIPHFDWNLHSSDEDDLNGDDAEEHPAWNEAVWAGGYGCCCEARAPRQGQGCNHTAWLPTSMGQHCLAGGSVPTVMTDPVSVFSRDMACRCAGLQAGMLCGMRLCVHADVQRLLCTAARGGTERVVVGHKAGGGACVMGGGTECQLMQEVS